MASSPATHPATARRAVMIGVVVAVAVLAVVAVSSLPSAETVVLEWTLAKVFDFGRWVGAYLLERGIELSVDLLRWLREQWERFVDPG